MIKDFDEAMGKYISNSLFSSQFMVKSFNIHQRRYSPLIVVNPNWL